MEGPVPPPQRGTATVYIFGMTEMWLRRVKLLIASYDVELRRRDPDEDDGVLDDGSRA